MWRSLDTDGIVLKPLASTTEPEHGPILIVSKYLIAHQSEKARGYTERMMVKRYVRFSKWTLIEWHHRHTDCIPTDKGPD